MRKLALGTWRDAWDPSVYGSMTLRMDKALDYMEQFRERTGKRLTITHMVARVMGLALQEMPDANAILRFNKIWLRQNIGVFFQVAMQDPETGEIDLSGVTIHEPQKKSLEEIHDEFTTHVKKVRQYKDENLEQTRSLIKRLPYFMLQSFVSMLGLFAYTFNLDMRKFGVPKDAFGSAMVTNVGSLGLEEAYVPLVPYSRVPLLIAMGPVQETPVVDDGQLAVAKTMKIFATFDHRILDGSHAAVMSKVFRRCFDDPESCFGPLPTAESSTSPS